MCSCQFPLQKTDCIVCVSVFVYNTDIYFTFPIYIKLPIYLVHLIIYEEEIEFNETFKIDFKCTKNIGCQLFNMCLIYNYRCEFVH